MNNELIFCSLNPIRVNYDVFLSFLPLVNGHRPLIPLLILRRLLIPVLPLLLGQCLEVPRDNLRNLAKLGLGVGSLDIVPRGIGVEEEGGLVALGSVGILLLFLPFSFFGCVGVGIGVGFGGGFVVFHLGLVALLIFDRLRC